MKNNFTKKSDPPYIKKNLKIWGEKKKFWDKNGLLIYFVC